MHAYTYSIYDSDPMTSSVDAWPGHDDETVEADDAAEAIDEVRAALEICAVSCDPADGYDAGDVLHALVWDEDGTVLATLQYTLTAEDLDLN